MRALMETVRSMTDIPVQACDETRDSPTPDQMKEAEDPLACARQWLMALARAQQPLALLNELPPTG
jgi:hypothetical protein